MQKKSGVLLCFILSICSSTMGHSLDSLGLTGDTVRLKKNKVLILEDTVLVPGNDTLVVIPDTASYNVRNNPFSNSRSLYLKLQDFADNNKLTENFFKLILVEEELKSEKEVVSGHYSDSPFEAYKGLIIAQIRIKHVDILEGNVNDTTQIASSRLAQLANNAHVDTWNSMIRNSLLLSKGEEIDPALMADAERVLRRFSYIEDARIYVTPISPSEARIDVVVKDRFAWGFEFVPRGIDSYRTEIFNRNILGSGKYISGSWYFTPNRDRKHGVEMHFGGQNLRKTITTWDLSYINRVDRISWGINMQKEFVSPETKYGGGLEMRAVKDSSFSLDGERSEQAFNQYDFQDLWIGRSFMIRKNGERKNITVTARAFNNRFDSRPVVTRDSNTLFYNRLILLGEVSYAKQAFFKSNYIQSFGIAEDIPLGYRFSLLYGQDLNEFDQQDYYGVKAFWARYINNFGYLTSDTELGGYQELDYIIGVVKTRIDYFSPLVSVNQYHIRNFLTFDYVKGFNQRSTREVSLGNRVRDIGGQGIMGNEATAIEIRSVLFTPWYLIGFRMAPFAYFNVSGVKDFRASRNLEKRYSSFGFGVLIKNESLAFNTLELRLNHFNQAPDGLEPTVFTFSFFTNIGFNNIFRYKPTLVTFH